MTNLGIVIEASDRGLRSVEVKNLAGQTICRGQVNAWSDQGVAVNALLARAVAKGVDLGGADLSAVWRLPKDSRRAKLRGARLSKNVDKVDFRGADLRNVDLSTYQVENHRADRPMVDDTTRLDGASYPTDFFRVLNPGEKILIHLREQVSGYGFGGFDTPFSGFEGRGLDLTKIPVEYLDECALAGYTYIMGLDMSASSSWRDFSTVPGNGYCHKIIGTRGTGNSGRMILVAASKHASERLRLGRIHMLMAEENLSFTDAQLIEQCVIRRRYGREIIGLVLSYLREGSCTKQIWDIGRRSAASMNWGPAVRHMLRIAGVEYGEGWSVPRLDSVVDAVEDILKVRPEGVKLP